MKINCFLLLTLMLMLASDLAYAHTFDYLFSCDNCKQPDIKAKYLVPDYSGPSDNDEDESKGENFSVLLVDAVKSEYHAYEVFVDYQQKTVDEIILNNKEQEIASNALAMARIKTKLKSMFNRNIDKLSFPNNYINKQVYRQSGVELDCQDPGVAAKSRVCQDVYTREIAAETLSQNINELLLEEKNWLSEATFNFGVVNWSLKQVRQGNIIRYITKDGQIIAFKFSNDSHTAVAFSNKESVYSNGTSVFDYQEMNEFNSGWGYDAENWVKSNGCTVLNGKFSANYIYSITRESDGSIDVETVLVEEQEIEIDCD
ncbi:hypothetical protein FLM48_15300 [Shewanella sp. Scap07]|uniref:hypothetical protein n=1 Tax=Shewanella sp. Scap07 TaxID=2589987 RepID=UPI0015BC0FA2|nr:hypothetical protein [Shewanella sp. Scap07]QLE86318.1 hypothetical protein FLM48_15300 [Shewanella sp. Scap07]